MNKWPDGPRYVVGSVTGMRIGPELGASNPPWEHGATLWYVNDAAYCYQTLHEGWVEADARALAARLNGEAGE